MEITFISDTHKQHNLLALNGGDMIIHCGDICSRGLKGEAELFLEWYNELPYKYKILIAGNHDFYFEEESDDAKELLKQYPNIIYLNDNGVEIEGIKIWGSPVQPWFYDWAFNRRGEEIKPHWDLIPLDTNILITHGPVKGILDKTVMGESVGCPYLRDKIKELKQLNIHACGHIHEAYGTAYFPEGPTYFNCSVLDEDYYMRNKPIIINLEYNGSLRR